MSHAAAYATVINRILNHAHPRHRITEHLRKRIRIDRMPLTVINERRVKLRNAALRHFTVARLFAATRTAARTTPDIRLCYRELTVNCGDIVVPRLCISIERVGKRILALTDIRL